MKITTKGPQSVGQIADAFEAGILFLSPTEYQRENAWDIDQKKLLIDTIFRHLDIPKFYLWRIGGGTLVTYPAGEVKDYYTRLLDEQRRRGHPDPYVLEVVDGQQRIRTILEFMGKAPRSALQYRGTWLQPFSAMEDTPFAQGQQYANLIFDQTLEFKQYSLSMMVLEDANIDEIREMFLRLQNGTPLNAQQKRDATGSDVGRVAQLISGLPFFATAVPFDNERGDHRRVASQMLLLEYKDRISPCTSQRLDKFYADHCQGRRIEASVANKVKNVVQMLGRIFPQRNPHLNRTYALSLFWVLSRIAQTYTIPEADLARIRENFEGLDVRRLEAGQRDYANRPHDEPYEELSLSMSYGTDGSEKIEARHEILMQYLFDGVGLTPLPQLDPNRLFSHEEKLILYHRAGGRCQLSCNGVECGREIPFDEASIDHIVPHSRGGRTEIGNGRYAASSCNISRRVREDFDPARECLRIIAQNP
jgi:Protein of unknown function DUF262/HNH endonuclease